MYDDSAKAIESRKDKIEDAGGIFIDGTAFHGAEVGFDDTSPKPEAPKPTPPNPYHGGQGGVHSGTSSSTTTTGTTKPGTSGGYEPQGGGGGEMGGGGGSPGSEGPGGSNEMGSF